MGNSLVQNDTALDQAIEAIARDLACYLREHLDNPETVSGLRVALKAVFRSYIGTGFLSFGASLSFALSHALRDALEGHGQPDPTVTKNVQEFPEFAVLARTLGSTGGVFRTYANRLGGGRSSHASSIPKDALRCLDHYPTWHAELDARMDELMLAAQRPHTPVDLSRAEYDASYQEAADEAEVNRARVV